MSIDKDTLEASEWVKRGLMRIRRSALDCDDPESWPSLWFNKFKEYMPDYMCQEVGCEPPNIPYITLNEVSRARW